MKLTNRLGYPVPYMEAAKKHIYPKVAGRIGATTLIDSPQVRRLMIEHWDELEQDVEAMFVAMLGTAWHKFLENNSPKELRDKALDDIQHLLRSIDELTRGGCLDEKVINLINEIQDKLISLPPETSNINTRAEKKWEYPIDDFTLVGVADIVAAGIADYKLISAWSWVFGEKDKWEKQLNILNYLQNKVDNKNAEYLKVYAFVKDWSKYKAMQDKDYPQKRFFILDIPIWPLEKTEAYIKERIAIHKDLTYQCTDEDKWIRIKNFAVKKKDAKRATRCFDTAAEAEQYVISNNLITDYGNGKIIIECRKTEPRRCAEFCVCKSVCSFGKTLKC